MLGHKQPEPLFCLSLQAPYSLRIENGGWQPASSAPRCSQGLRPGERAVERTREGKASGFLGVPMGRNAPGRSEEGQSAPRLGCPCPRAPPQNHPAPGNSAGRWNALFSTAGMHNWLLRECCKTPTGWVVGKCGTRVGVGKRGARREQASAPSCPPISPTERPAYVFLQQPRGAKRVPSQTVFGPDTVTKSLRVAFVPQHHGSPVPHPHPTPTRNLGTGPCCSSQPLRGKDLGSTLTFAICAWTPLALSAVTAFCAAEGLSKSTKP